LVTTTLYFWGRAAAGIIQSQEICAGETATTFEHVEMMVEVFLNRTEANGWKPVPARFEILTVVPCTPVVGKILVIEGLALLIVNAIVPDDCPSVLVTRIAQFVAAVAPTGSNLQVIEVDDTTTTSYALMTIPLRAIFTVAPGWNPVPVRVTLTGHPRTAVVGFLTARVGTGLATLI
jgi:hypothetical protein